MRNVTLAAIVATVAGCGTILPDDGLVVDVQVASVTAGAPLPFTFANESRHEVVTGALDCVVTYERREGAAWVPVAPLRSCIEIVERHPAGSSREYQTTAPEQAGTWRLVVQAWTGGDAVAVRSGTFAIVGG